MSSCCWSSACGRSPSPSSRAQLSAFPVRGQLSHRRRFSSGVRIDFERCRGVEEFFKRCSEYREVPEMSPSLAKIRRPLSLLSRAGSRYSPSNPVCGMKASISGSTRFSFLCVSSQQLTPKQITHASSPSLSHRRPRARYIALVRSVVVVWPVVSSSAVVVVVVAVLLVLQDVSATRALNEGESKAEMNSRPLLPRSSRYHGPSRARPALRSSQTFQLP